MSGLTSDDLNEFISEALREFNYEEINHLDTKIQIANDVETCLSQNQPLDKSLQDEYLKNAKQAFCNIFLLLGKLQNIREKLKTGTLREKAKAAGNALTAENDIEEIQNNFKCLSDENILQVYNMDTAIFASNLLVFFKNHENNIQEIVKGAKEEKYALVGIVKNLIPNLQKSIDSFNRQRSQIEGQISQDDITSSNNSDESSDIETQEKLTSAEFLFHSDLRDPFIFETSNISSTEEQKEEGEYTGTNSITLNIDQNGDLKTLTSYMKPQNKNEGISRFFIDDINLIQIMNQLILFRLHIC